MYATCSAPSSQLFDGCQQCLLGSHMCAGQQCGGLWKGIEPVGAQKLSLVTVLLWPGQAAAFFHACSAGSGRIMRLTVLLGLLQDHICRSDCHAGAKSA
jgi:hypothetical protein